jgi:uncharacterized protein YjbI with pentapeptide repeats
VALAIPASASATVVNGCTIAAFTSCPRADLHGANLPGADLHGANLRGADLRGADLSGANLSEADLTGADLQSAHLQGANLRRSYLTDANLAASDLRDAALSGAYMTRTDLRIASLPRANLFGADVRGANVESADLDGAELGNATFDGAKLNYAKLVAVKASSARFAGALLRHADMSSGDFVGANFDGSQLDFANLIDAQLVRVQARSTNFAIAQMQRAMGWSGEFHGANFYGTRLTDAVFGLADVRNASFIDADFNHTDFQAAKVGGAILFPSNIASDRTARWYFFSPVTTHVNAYGDYGHCDGSGSSANNAVSCSGRNDERSATFGLQGGVSFLWGTQRADGRRGFSVTGSNGVQLFGESDLGLSAFHAIPVGLGDLSATGEHSPRGEPGGPLALYIGYSAHFPTPGYVMGITGWLRREGTAPSGPQPS